MSDGDDERYERNDEMSDVIPDFVDELYDRWQESGQDSWDTWNHDKRTPRGCMTLGVWVLAVFFMVAYVINDMINDAAEPPTADAPPAQSAPRDDSDDPTPQPDPTGDVDRGTVAPTPSAAPEGADESAATAATPAAVTAAPVTTTTLPPLVPLAGTWTISNLPGVFDCGGMQFPMAPSIDTAVVSVLDGGERLSSPAEGYVLDLNLVGAGPDRAIYEGALDASALGDDAAQADELDFVTTFVFDRPDHFTGLMEGTVVSQGLTCSIDRPVEGTLAAASAGNVATVTTTTTTTTTIPPITVPDS